MKKEHLFILMIVLTLICGVSIGVIAGEYKASVAWKDYVNQSYICVHPQQNDIRPYEFPQMKK